MLEEFEEMLGEHGRETFPNILFVSSECMPLAKTGGLADVVGTLPKSLGKLGMDARVITPYHSITKRKFRDKVEHMFHFYVDIGWRHEYCGIEKLVLDGVTIYLVDSEKYFGDKIYRGGYQEIEQYAFFQRAVLDAIPSLDFKPDIVHCNDWQAGMIPMLARTQYKGCMQESLKYLLTIHNIAYQGKWDFDYFRDLFGIPDYYYTPEYIELDKDANMLKAGCVFADRLSTVSPNYANEIKTPYFAEGLQGILNARSAQLCGILNGIDTDVFNPEKDDKIPFHYTVKDLGGKGKCKQALQEQMGLNVDPDVPIIGMVMRMTEQKGFELVMNVLDDLMMYENCQFMLLGTGDSRYEDFMRGAEQRYKGRLCAYIGYDEDLSHLIYAGTDLFLMPSRFEPCGLSQMIAMRYGSLPVVRETGGLKDSVIPYNCITMEGDGFSFANFDAWEMRATLHYAIETWKDEKARKLLIHNAMVKDFSFERSAKDYVRLYISMLDGYHETPPVLAHDASSLKNRTPFGAVKTGEKMTLTLDILKGRLLEATVTLYRDLEVIEVPMKVEKKKATATFTAPESAGDWYYRFRVETKYGTRFFCANAEGFGGHLSYEEGACYRLTVYLKDFKTPDWFKGSVMYQIFPDRFGFYGKNTAQKGIKYHKDLGQTPTLHASTDEPVKYQPTAGEMDYYPDDFYGGTLKGIREKLPYLKNLGINVIYLNPIVEARSNHRYDTSNYMNVDPVLGTVEDFENLCAEAKKNGIRLILDGVYSHTGSDSIYFNRYNHYDSKGACNGEDSPYYPWYSFDSYPNSYKSWWGFVDLPEVDERNPEWQDYIITGKNSVMKTWLKRGASGWRLDVADEIPDDVLALMRQEVKKVYPDAPIIGEVWEDPIIKCGPEGKRNYALGYSLDSVMNYPLRFALIDYLHYRVNSWGFRDFLLSQQMNYPAPLYNCLMNMLSTHDVDRIRTALATDVTVRNLSREDQLKLEFTEDALKKAVALEKIAVAILFMIPGNPCIYYGDEQGMTGVCDPFNRLPFREDTENTGLKETYKKFADLRNTYESMKKGEAAFFALDVDVMGILRIGKEKGNVLAIINRGGYDFKYELDLSAYQLGKVKGTVSAMDAEIKIL